jgi:hypothetical protein
MKKQITINREPLEDSPCGDAWGGPYGRERSSRGFCISHGGVAMKKDAGETGEIKTIEDVKRAVRGIQEKVDRCRFRTNVLQEVFINHPEGIDDGPEDLTLFYMSIKTVLDDIMENGCDASDTLTDLFHSDALKAAEVS